MITLFMKSIFSIANASLWRISPRAAVTFLAAAVTLSAAAARNLNPAARFFPDQDSIAIEETMGTPPSAVVRAANGRVLGYAFSTWAVSGSVGYSGRPLDILAVVTPEGIIAGAQIVAHEEPILVIGIPREALAAYVANFKGLDVRATAGLRRTAKGMFTRPQAVAGATVTSAVIRDALLRSARAVLRARTASAEPTGKPRLDRESLRAATWRELVSEGGLRRLIVSRGDAARMLGTFDAEPDKTFIDLWLALASSPAIGESLIGKRDYDSAVSDWGADDDLVVIAATGLYSFKGTQWRRTGVFDRIEIIQGDKTIRLRAEDHRRIESLRAPGAPDVREVGFFRIAHASGFDPTAPFRLDLTLNGDTPPAAAAPVVVALDYRIPDMYVIHPLIARPAPAMSSDRADTAVVRGTFAEPPMQAPLWQDIWWARKIEVAVLALMLVGLGAILIFQDAVAARANLYHRLRTAYLIVTFVFLGLIANAQLSVVNVVTFIHALLSGFRWELFLLDPLVFILWSFVAVSMLFWGRGVFCGWLCPFGALQELLNMLARRIGVRQINISFGLHERLWMIKYVIFLGILAISLHSIMAAFTLAEVEPFKTTITLKLVRDWPFVVYAGLLLATGLFIERFFCRYLCPLGGALAIPARVRMFEWLNRRKECGVECQVCAKRCTVQAIHPLGDINPNECIYCLQCQANYFDHAVCPPLLRREERRRQQKANAARLAAAQGKSHAS
jgi:transcriptional regulator of nitric oxide reductase